MKAEEPILARRILEAGRGIAKEELLEPAAKERDWMGELREAGLDKVWELERELAPVVAAWSIFTPRRIIQKGYHSPGDKLRRKLPVPSCGRGLK